jgi:tight adherence protein C
MRRRVNTDAGEVAVIASVIALGLRGGLTVAAALELALVSASGRVADYLRQVLSAIDLGAPTARTLGEAAIGSKSPPVEELLNKLHISSELGSGLAEQLDDLSASLRQQVATLRLARSTASETKMLLPLVFLILPVTVVFALYPSMQILNIPMEGM